MVLIVVFVLELLQPSMCKVYDSKCTINKSLSSLHKHFQEGDLIIGGIISLISATAEEMKFQKPSNDMAYNLSFVRTYHYQHVLAMVFAVKEINENPKILPNVTLGFHICNNYMNDRETYRATMQLPSTRNRFIPNYKCDFQNNLIAVVGGAEAKMSHLIATVLSIYNIAQLAYGTTTVTKETFSRLSMYRMVTNEAQQFKGILQLILHFRWTWIGLIVVDDERGERFQQAMLPMFSQNGICVAFTEKIHQAHMIEEFNDMIQEGEKSYKIVIKSKADVVVFFGDTGSVSYLRCIQKLIEMEPKGKVYIMTIQMDFASFRYQRDWDNMDFHGSISFRVHTNEPSGFHQFLQSRKPLRTEGDGFIREFWEDAFLCQFNDSLVQKEFHTFCTGEEKMESLPGDTFEMSMTGTSYSIYNAVYAVAHALHGLYSSQYGHRGITKRKKCNLFNPPPWKASILGRMKNYVSSTEVHANFTSIYLSRKDF